MDGMGEEWDKNIIYEIQKSCIPIYRRNTCQL